MSAADLMRAVRGADKAAIADKVVGAAGKVGAVLRG